MSPKFKEYLAASYPVLYCQTHELDRAIKEFSSQAQAEKLEFNCFIWDCHRGLIGTNSQRYKAVTPENLPKEISELPKNSIVFAQNYNLFWDDPLIIQDILNHHLGWKAIPQILMVLSPRMGIPIELEKIINLVDFPYPNAEQLQTILEGVAKSANIDLPKDCSAITEAALGLTAFEAESDFTMSAIYLGEEEFNPRIIAEYKMQTIKKSGLLEVWEPQPLDQLGGINKLKNYWANRKPAFRDSNKPKLKGVLLLGVPGCGKTLAGKVAASIFETVLVRLDAASLKASLVGQSEANMRQACKILDGLQTAVLVLDEVEKAWGGVQSSGISDAGTTLGMFGYFLTWLQETKSRIYTIATANSLKGLPPEFLRAGRFDALWFIDLPNSQEISEIIKIMNKRYSTEMPLNWASKLRGFTGAEIEQVARDSVFDGLEEAYKNIVPLEKTMAEEIKDLRAWAADRARIASGPEEEPKSGRKVQKIEKFDPRIN